jgi:hypothetical protein
LLKKTKKTKIKKMKTKWFHAKDDPLYLSLILVAVLFFISALAACFSFLIVSEKKVGFLPEAWQAQNSTKENGAGQEEKQLLTIDDIKVAELSGEVVEVQDNKIVFKTIVYGDKEQTFAIALNDEESNKIVKFVQAEQVEGEGLPKIQRQNFDFEKLKAGDFITFRFPLEVPVSEIESSSLVIEELIVNDDYDSSLAEE